MASKQDRLATPLVLPNNSNWDEKTGKYTTKPNVKRQNLTVVPEALKQLKEIKGPVCVVSIAGPCRSGKSYILSNVFDQEQVFPLGHLLDPETMGIWLWVVPEKFKDSTGREFTVVLMDSEGIDAVSSKQSDDHRIFTLLVLLSSIMIYNSVGVPKRSDLEDLDFIGKMSQHIQLQTKQSTADEQQFSEAFPYFIWLLRDVLLSRPKGYKTMKDYLLKRVLNIETEGDTEKVKKTAESILKNFSGFDAFSLPPPTYDNEVITNLDDEKFKSQINPKFLKEVKDFKVALHSKLSPKKSISKEEFVTGEALAALIELFVDALNTPDAVPNVQKAWDTFVHTKLSQVLADAVKAYEQEMTRRLVKKIPCEVDVPSAHKHAFKMCYEMFRNDTSSFSQKSVDKYLMELKDKTDSIFISWLKWKPKAPSRQPPISRQEHYHGQSLIKDLNLEIQFEQLFLVDNQKPNKPVLPVRNPSEEMIDRNLSEEMIDRNPLRKNGSSESIGKDGWPNSLRQKLGENSLGEMMVGNPLGGMTSGNPLGGMTSGNALGEGSISFFITGF